MWVAWITACLGLHGEVLQQVRRSYTEGSAAVTGREAVKMAERLADEQANVSIFALGVGRGVEKTELERIIAVCGADKVRDPM